MAQTSINDRMMTRLIPAVLAMAAVVALSNFAVQYPIALFGLQDYLTWGALTYPVAFLVNDLTNRRFGPRLTRRVIYCGFAIAVVLSIALATPRIALASGTAFLLGQLLDITVFNRLRRLTWWQAPLAGSLLGSALDTVVFFSLAFAGDPMMSGPVTYAPFGLETTVPLWVGLAFFDFLVKVSMALLMLVPYGALMSRIRPMEAVRGHDSGAGLKARLHASIRCPDLTQIAVSAIPDGSAEPQQPVQMKIVRRIDTVKRESYSPDRRAQVPRCPGPLLRPGEARPQSARAYEVTPRISNRVFE